MTDSTERSDFRIADSMCYVKIKYSVRVENGPMLKGGSQPEIMDFVTGYRHVIPGLEKRLIGRHAGEKLSFTVPPEEAFGIRRKELVIEKDWDSFHFPADVEPYPGMEIPLVALDENAPDTVIIKEILEDKILIDLNHPLAGAALRYDLEIVEARPAMAQDTCSEWETAASEQSCASTVPEILLPGQEQLKE